MRRLFILSLILALLPLSVAATEPLDGEFLVRLSSGLAAPAGVSDVVRINDSWILVSHPMFGSPQATAADLENRFGVRVVPNRILELAGPTDEPRYNEQWSLENTGQTGGTAGADIDARAAWLITTGREEVVVAIIDSGVDLEHADLNSQLWINPAEIPANGADDDGNGYIDDTHGWDFITDDNLPLDELGHGTRVAGLVGAAVNNLGITGIAPDVRLMVVRVCSSSCPLSAIVQGVEYAVANGASIINLSLGGTGSGFDPLGESIEAAGEMGVLVVAAAGNSGWDTDVAPYLPAAFPGDNIVSVSATNHDDLLSGFSNFGAATVDLAAPGEDLLSTTPAGWATGSGTSYAAPLVAGTAALMRSLKPSLTPDQIRRALISNADPLDSLAGTSVSGGRLNAGAAVRFASSPVALATVTPPVVTHPAEAVFDGSGSWDPNGSITSHRWTFSDGVEMEGGVVLRQISVDGDISATLTVTDEDGLEDSTEVTVAVNSRPQAVISASSVLGEVPLVVYLDAAESTDPDGAITRYDWALGDGSAVSGITVEHQYQTPGRFEPKLTVTDDVGATDSTATPILVGQSFDDTVGSVYRDDITWLSALGYTDGCSASSYCPDRPVTRGEAAAFLRRVGGLQTGPDAFADDGGHLFESDIDAIAAAEITFGCNPPANDRYCPDEFVTREQMAAFLVRAFDFVESSGNSFLDVSTDSEFRHDVDRLATAGITTGCNPPDNTLFCPTDFVTRGQLAAFLRRAMG